MPNNKFVLYAKRIAIATAIIVVVLHQFCPRNTLALLRIEHDEIARIEVTMIPDDSVDIVSFFVEKPEMINQLLDYISNLNRDPVQYLEDGTRAFIDTYSMSFPKEDRARIMQYAATADHGYYFESEIMQRKLRTLCEGIRIAFDLRECPVAFVWEQYLQEPLTP